VSCSRSSHDLVTAVTMTHAGEAIGIARAAAAAGLPSAISFTVETDGRLPDGRGLRESLEATDEATDGAPAYYMINCAHPMHFAGVLEDDDSAWRERICGLRANASALSHAELDEAEELDEGDPEDLGRRYRALRDALPAATVLGGCCGTDVRHVRAILEAWTA
jgi:S-methylmethionine-dependent homocysteine/selenocysteine methylase